MTFLSLVFSGVASQKKSGRCPETKTVVAGHSVGNLAVTAVLPNPKTRRQRNREKCQKELDIFLKTYGLTDVHSHRSTKSLPETEGLYPIHLAAIEGNYKVVRHILAAGADTDQMSPCRRTALDFAEALNENGSHEDVLFLLRGKVKVLGLGAAVKHMQEDFDCHGLDVSTERLPEQTASLGLRFPSRGIHKIAI